jgi:hypothetical protein
MIHRTLAMTAVAVVLAVPGHALAQAAPAAKPAAQSPARPVEYRPPARGAPKVRVGGSTRSLARSLTLVVITPDHVGLAATEQPELFWYISQPSKAPIEFSIVPVDGAEPLLDTTLPPASVAGIHRIRLSDLGVRLKAGEEYQWTIAVPRQEGSRLKDAVASGRVRVQSPPARIDGFAQYARAGYWYDAVAQLRALIERQPGDDALLAAQQSLLEQVGLADVVRIDAR